MSESKLPSALSGATVLEFGTMIAGPYCAKMLGDLGAEVIKVEPPEGDPSRQYGPFPDDEANPEQSALFLYTNTSKRGITLDLSNEDDLNTFKELVEWADVLIDNHHPSPLAELGLDWATIHALNPSLIYTRITPYGLTGPNANVAGDELTLVQSSGFGNVLPTRSVDVDRAPIKPGGNPVGFHSGLCAAVATIAALMSRDKSGEGSLIDISLQEAMLAMVAPQVAHAFYHKTTWSRVPDRPPAMGRMQTSDGYVILNALDDHHFGALRNLMGNPEWCAGEEWLSMRYRANNVMDIAARIDAWMLTQKKDEIHHAAGSKRIPIGPMYTAEDVMNYQQYEARDYFVEVEHPVAGTQRYAGWPYQLPASPPCVHRSAPLLGQHNDEIRAGVERLPTKVNPVGTGNLPLEGVRVLEFAWVWAGPYAGLLLAQLGAEVIKVESRDRMDLMRRTIVWPLSEPAPEQKGPNESIPFNAMNMNKKSIDIDMSTPEGLAIAKKLASTADIVFDNMRPGALGKLGLDYNSLCALKPDVIVASSSGRGTKGPEREYLGYAMIHHALGGHSYITGYPDDHPCHTTGDVDLMNATALAFSMLAALHHRARTGEGQFIDYSQTEAVTTLIGDVMLGYELNGTIPERQGNLHPHVAPHNVYRAWGVDRWIAIEVHDDDSFARLASAIEQPELASDSRFATNEARKENEAVLDTILGAWTRQQDRDRMVRKLNKAGIMAAPSRNVRDLYADRHLQERDAFVTVTHPDLGDLDFVGPPWKMEGMDVSAERAPFIGEHTEEVLKECAGVSDDELVELRAKNVIV